MSTNSSNDFRYHQSLKDFWLLFYQNKVALYSFYLLVGLIFIAFFAPFLAPHNPYQQFTQEVLSPPSWFKEGKISYFFGTDHLGRDIFSRLILGTRYTFGSAIIVTLVTASIGGGSVFGLAFHKKVLLERSLTYWKVLSLSPVF